MLEHISKVEHQKAKRCEDRFRAGRSALHFQGRLVIVVDDGLATGATMRAAVRSLRARGAQFIVIAAPVGSVEACETLASDADALVCPHQPDPFYAVDQYYEDSRQTSDSEVERCLRAAHPCVRCAGRG
jgi:predicted phosphoribosyltransferase